MVAWRRWNHNLTSANPNLVFLSSMYAILAWVKVRVRGVKVRVSAGKVNAVVPTSQSKHETIQPIE